MGLFNSPLLAGGRDRLRMAMRRAETAPKRQPASPAEEQPGEVLVVGGWKLKVSAAGDLVACDPTGKETTVAVSVKLPPLPKK